MSDIFILLFYHIISIGCISLGLLGFAILNDHQTAIFYIIVGIILSLIEVKEIYNNFINK